MSNIQWTDITANPIHLIREDGSNGGHFCNKVSPGCLHCYAEEMNQSNYFKFASHLPYSGSAPDNLIFDDKVMQELMKTRSSKKIFLCSMTDLFGEWVPDAWIDQAFAYMALASQHTFQILTKRPERMKEYFALHEGKPGFYASRSEMVFDALRKIKPEAEWNKFIWPLPNCWLGVSVENQKAADSRIPLLLMTPAKIKFLSCEPLLEAIDLRKHLGICVGCQTCSFAGNHQIAKSKINWIIIGGESGKGARTCNIDWIRSIVQHCQKAETAVFVKQLGSNAVEPAYLKYKTSDRKGGKIDEFPDDLRVREFPFFQE